MGAASSPAYDPKSHGQQGWLQAQASALRAWGRRALSGQAPSSPWLGDLAHCLAEPLRRLVACVPGLSALVSNGAVARRLVGINLLVIAALALSLLHIFYKRPGEIFGFSIRGTHKWVPLDPTEYGGGNLAVVAGAGGTHSRLDLPEWGVVTALHRAAAAYCIASPPCRYAVVFMGGDEDPREDTELTVRHAVDAGAEARGELRVVPVVRLHELDEYAITAGATIVMCPNPKRDVWLVYGDVRWALFYTDSNFLEGCASNAARSMIEGGAEESATRHILGNHSSPHWVTCEWLQRLAKGDPIYHGTDCAFGPGSIVGLARSAVLGSAPLALLAQGGDLLLHGPEPEPGVLRKFDIRTLATVRGVPQPGDGVQSRLSVLAAGKKRTAASLHAPPAADVQRLFEEMRENEFALRPIALPPTLEFSVCHEWPARGALQAACGARPFNVHDYLLAVKNAVLLADWHRYRLLLPDMQSVHHEESEGPEDPARHDRLPPGRLLDVAVLSRGLRGTVEVVDTHQFNPDALLWSARYVAIAHHVGSTDASQGADAEAELHAALKAATGVPGKIAVDVCPAGAVTWEPRAQTVWHMPLRARTNSAMDAPRHIMRLREAFVFALRKQTATRSFNAVDLRRLAPNQQRCRCNQRGGGGRSLLCSQAVQDVANVLVRLGFARDAPLFVALDDEAAEDTLRGLRRLYRAALSVKDLMPSVTHGSGAALHPQELELLEGVIAEEADAFAGQFNSALSYHVKERRAHRTDTTSMRSGQSAAAVQAAWLPRASYYFDRKDPHSCAITPARAAAEVRAPGGAAFVAQYYEPCQEEIDLWLES